MNISFWDEDEQDRVIHFARNMKGSHFCPHVNEGCLSLHDVKIPAVASVGSLSLISSILTTRSTKKLGSTISNDRRDCQSRQPINCRNVEATSRNLEKDCFFFFGFLF